ncbi:MAG: hypothetical protein E4H03_00255 [Myxococcales bacterium]|jgi:hypothetical protein|nr:MAG: hypothetical protein E4H03_00255 [Myxococcales bacterium]
MEFSPLDRPRVYRRLSESLFLEAFGRRIHPHNRHELVQLIEDETGFDVGTDENRDLLATVRLKLRDYLLAPIAREFEHG